MNPPSNPPLPPNDTIYNEQNLEAVIRTLQDLGQKKPIREPEDIRRQEESLRTAREFDFTNKEASILSNGDWGEDRIKKITSGVKVKDRATKEEAIRLLTQMVSEGLTLRDVRAALSIKAVLDKQNASLEDVVSIIRESKESKIPLQALTTDYRQRAEAGLSLLQLKELLSYKQQLDEVGFTTDGGLEQLALAAKSHNNDVNKVIEAVNKIGGLPAIQKKLKELQYNIDAEQERIRGLDGEISAKEARKAELEAPLNRLDRILALGFDEQSFGQIYQIATTGGKVKRSVKEIVDSLAKYSNLLDLEQDMSDLYKKKRDVESDLKQSEIDYAHRQTLLQMCDDLLYKYKFSLPAIRDLVRIAKDYGEPVAVFDALAKYGSIQDLENEIAGLEKSKADLEAKLAELERRANELHAKADAIREFITTSINPLNEEFKRAAADLERTYHSQITLLKTEAAEYGKRLGEVKYLEESLKLARFFHLIIKVPSEAAAFPIDYAVFILDGVARFCIAKNVNPPVKISATLARMGVLKDDTVPVSTVINIARKQLEEYTNVV